MHSFLVKDKANQINLFDQLWQAMYASVHDAALAVATAVHNLMNSGREGMKSIDSHFTDSECPLRSASAWHGGLGWKLLHQLKKVKTALNGDKVLLYN